LKVKATQLFRMYRNKVLGLPKKDFDALGQGKEVEVDDKIVKKWPKLFAKEVKRGDRS
jgi:hypothetical protein